MYWSPYDCINRTNVLPKLELDEKHIFNLLNLDKNCGFVIYVIHILLACTFDLYSSLSFYQ